MDNIDSKQKMENLNQKITDGIYEACVRNRRKETLFEMIAAGSENLQNCDSKNLRAIADANAVFFQSLAEKEDPTTQTYKERSTIPINGNTCTAKSQKGCGN